MTEYGSLDMLLYEMIERGASDLHLNHLAPITFRVEGVMVQTDTFIDGDDIFGMLVQAKAIGSEEQRTYFTKKSIDFSYALDDEERTRFRGSLVYQKGFPSCVLRKIDGVIRSMEALQLPEVAKNMIWNDWGMVLVTGATGSGKSTTLASMIDTINAHKAFHIATVEQPIEYIHTNKQSIVTQREVGKDTPSFEASMIDILRLDPDVIMVGEMRDFETMKAAVDSAETGHLVFGTLHTNNAPQSINRIVTRYPADEHASVRNQLANHVIGIINQRLVPNPKGGRTPLYEVMVMEEEIRTLIREGRDEEILQVMRKNRDIGHVLLEDSKKQAKAEGRIY